MHDMTQERTRRAPGSARRAWLGSHTRSRLALIGGVAGAAALAGGVAANPAMACSTTVPCMAGKNWDVTGSGTATSSVDTVQEWVTWSVANWTTERSIQGVWAMWNSTNSWVGTGAWEGYLPGAGSTSVPRYYKGNRTAGGTVTYADVGASVTISTGPLQNVPFGAALVEGTGGSGCWTAYLAGGSAMTPMCGFPTSTQHLFAGIETLGTPSAGFKHRGSGSYADRGGVGWTGATSYASSGSSYCARNTGNGVSDAYAFATSNLSC